MGDRVSVQFQTEEEKSVVLFNHWGGHEFAEATLTYAQLLMKSRNGEMQPLDRFEPNTVMVDFIREVTKGEERIKSSLYLGATENDGDNSDNGHFIVKFDPQKREVTMTGGET